jgi:hypothetical protein
MSARSDGMASRMFGGGKGEMHRVESVGRKAGLSPEQVHSLDEWARKAVLPLFDGFGVDPQAKDHITAMAAHVAIENASGRITPAMVKAWDTTVMEEMRATHKLKSKAWAEGVLRGIDARLLKEKPEAYKALRNAYPITRHPVISRHLVNWELRRRGAEANSPAKYIHAVRTAQAGSAPSGSTSAAAVTALDRRPLALNPLGDADAA